MSHSLFGMLCAYHKDHDLSDEDVLEIVQNSYDEQYKDLLIEGLHYEELLFVITDTGKVVSNSHNNELLTDIMRLQPEHRFDYVHYHVLRSLYDEYSPLTHFPSFDVTNKESMFLLLRKMVADFVVKLMHLTLDETRWLFDKAHKSVEFTHLDKYNDVKSIDDVTDRVALFNIDGSMDSLSILQTLKLQEISLLYRHITQNMTLSGNMEEMFSHIYYNPSWPLRFYDLRDPYEQDPDNYRNMVAFFDIHS